MQDAIARGYADNAADFISEALEDKHHQAQLDRYLREVIVPRIEARGDDTSKLIPAEKIRESIKERRKRKKHH